MGEPNHSTQLHPSRMQACLLRIQMLNSAHIPAVMYKLKNVILFQEVQTWLHRAPRQKENKIQNVHSKEQLAAKRHRLNEKKKKSSESKTGRSMRINAGARHQWVHGRAGWNMPEG
jgi:hypothetical protein